MDCLDTRSLGKMAPLVIGLLTGLAEVGAGLIRERTESVEHEGREATLEDDGTPTDKEGYIVRLRRKAIP